MIQNCDIGLFERIVLAARQGNFGPFGIIQACLDMGTQERAAAMAILEQLEVTPDELERFQQGLVQHHQERSNAIR